MRPLRTITSLCPTVGLSELPPPGPRRISCDECGRQFETDDGLDRHEAKKHGKPLKAGGLTDE